MPLLLVLKERHINDTQMTKIHMMKEKISIFVTYCISTNVTDEIIWGKYIALCTMLNREWEVDHDRLLTFYEVIIDLPVTPTHRQPALLYCSLYN